MGRCRSATLADLAVLVVDDELGLVAAREFASLHNGWCLGRVTARRAFVSSHLDPPCLLGLGVDDVDIASLG